MEFCEVSEDFWVSWKNCLEISSFLVTRDKSPLLKFWLIILSLNGKILQSLLIEKIFSDKFVDKSFGIFYHLTLGVSRCWRQTFVYLILTVWLCHKFQKTRVFWCKVVFLTECGIYVMTFFN